MGHGRWSDDRFLDMIRSQADPLADQAVHRLMKDREIRAVNEIFKTLRSDADPLPPDTPEPFREFVEATGELPPWVDMERVDRGGRVFFKHAISSSVVLLASSLPRGYAAPCLCQILSISRDLQKHPYDRLMGVLQLMVNVAGPGSFAPGGRAVVTAQKLRLLHAGVRTLVPRFRPGYEQKHGLPVNHEDMLATIMGFSYLVTDGIRRMGLELSDAEAEDYYYLWRVYAQKMGIHPDGRPEDGSWVPADLAEAAEFYASYVRRQETGPAENPYGVVLTRDNLEMMKALIPKPLRLLGFGYAPRIAMTELLTAQELARVGLRPATGHKVVKLLFDLFLRLAQVGEALPFSSRLAGLMFQHMIDVDRGGEVTFTIPVTLAGLRSSSLV